MKKYIAISVFMVLFSCNNETGKGTTVKEMESPVGMNDRTRDVISDTTVTGCYFWSLGRDTAHFQVTKTGLTFSGPLVYNYFEKDRNDGTFQGGVEGDILSGWYLFRSEGLMSVRQVAWKIQPDKLIPAVGEMTERNDSLVYKDMMNLEFDQNNPFIKIPCTL